MTYFVPVTLNLLSLVAVAGAAWQVHRLVHVTTGTTAEAARRWGLAALLVCLLAAAVRLPWLSVTIRLQTALQYAAAVMLLTPLVAVLGARRPGANAWPWFVTLPLVAVLQWPSLSQLWSGRAATAIEIPTPTVIGFLFVLLMGAGNYFGTRHTLAALIGSVGVFLLVLPVSEWTDAAAVWPFPAGCLLLMMSALMIRTAVVSTPDSSEQIPADNTHRLWIEFRDLYGIVWAKRVMDRVNQFADRESWTVQLTLDGFVDQPSGQGASGQVPSEHDPSEQSASEQSASGHGSSGQGPSSSGRGNVPDSHNFSALLCATVPDRAVIVLCWLLQRFVDRSYLRRFEPETLIRQSLVAESPSARVQKRRRDSEPAD
ncbi:MAG: hypothetical protein RIK87_20135 [Fuerstiella sp.]